MKLQKLPNLDQIKALQTEAAKLPQAALETSHFWADGMYMRSVFRKKDTLIIGKVHRREHFFMVVSGDVTIVGDGSKERVKAPYLCVSAPGTKRATYAHEDSLCVTVHRTDKRDLDEIEAELVEPDDTSMFDSHNLIKNEIKVLT